MKQEQILSYLSQENVDFWDLISSDYFIKNTVKIIKDLKKNHLIEINNNKLSVTQKGENFVEKFEIIPEKFTQDIFTIDTNKKLINEFKKLRIKFPLSDEFDQQLLTDEAIFKKIAIMDKNGDLEGKKIVCLGDDDQFAIALALTSKPKKITVFDIDRRIINHQNKVLKDLGYEADCHYLDLLNPIPSDLQEKYDVFECEPPDNPKGHRLFMSRGTVLLKKTGGIGYTGICDQTMDYKSRIQIQKDILKMNGLITDIYPHFKLYETVGDEDNWVLNLPKEISLPKKPWFNSNLIRVKFTKHKKPLISGKADLSYVTELSKIIC